MIAKAIGATLVVGALGTGTVAFTKPGWLGMMPYYSKLSEDHNFKTGDNTSSEYSSKFGEEHKDNLVGVVGKNKDGDDNKDWWEWSFKKLTQTGISSGKFKHTKGGTDNAVTKAYAKDTTNDNEGSKALNQVCKEAYKASKESVKDNAGESDFNKEQVWKYCSWLGAEPKAQGAASS